MVQARDERTDIGGVQRHRETRVTGDFDAARSQRVAGGITRYAQLRYIDIVSGPAVFQEARAGDDHNARASVVGRARDRRHRDIGDRDAIAREISDHDRGVRACGPVFGGGEIVGGRTGRAGAVFIKVGVYARAIRRTQRDREARARGDFDVGGIGQRVRRPAFTGQGKFIGHDVVSCATEWEEVGARDDYYARASVVGRARDRRYGDSGDGDGDGPCRAAQAAIGGGDGDVVDVVRPGIAGGVEIGRGLEGDGA